MGRYRRLPSIAALFFLWYPPAGSPFYRWLLLGPIIYVHNFYSNTFYAGKLWHCCYPSFAMPMLWLLSLARYPAYPFGIPKQ